MRQSGVVGFERDHREVVDLVRTHSDLLRMRSATLPAFLALVSLVACASHQPVATVPESSAGALKVGGDLPRTGVLRVSDLEALGGMNVPWEFRDQLHEYHGVPLDRVLTHLGFDAGPGGPSIPPKDRRPGWRKIVLAKSSDGFVAVFTCAELMPEMGATRAYVVWRCDGQDLPPDEGPLRLVVATAKKGSRSVRQVVELRVADRVLATTSSERRPTR